MSNPEHAITQYEGVDIERKKLFQLSYCDTYKVDYYQQQKYIEYEVNDNYMCIDVFKAVKKLNNEDEKLRENIINFDKNYVIATIMDNDIFNEFYANYRNAKTEKSKTIITKYIMKTNLIHDYDILYEIFSIQDSSKINLIKRILEITMSLRDKNIIYQNYDIGGIIYEQVSLEPKFIDFFTSVFNNEMYSNLDSYFNDLYEIENFLYVSSGDVEEHEMNQLWKIFILILQLFSEKYDLIDKRTFKQIDNIPYLKSKFDYIISRNIKNRNVELFLYYLLENIFNNVSLIKLYNLIIKIEELNQQEFKDLIDTM